MRHYFRFLATLLTSVFLATNAHALGACTASTAGYFGYDATQIAFFFCDGTSWQELKKPATSYTFSYQGKPLVGANGGSTVTECTVPIGQSCGGGVYAGDGNLIAAPGGCRATGSSIPNAQITGITCPSNASYFGHAKSLTIATGAIRSTNGSVNVVVDTPVAHGLTTGEVVQLYDAPLHNDMNALIRVPRAVTVVDADTFTIAVPIGPEWVTTATSTGPATMLYNVDFDTVKWSQADGASGDSVGNESVYGYLESERRNAQTWGAAWRYPAIRYCATLVHNGYSDWYLPTAHESKVLIANSREIGGFMTSLTVNNTLTYYTQTELSGASNNGSDWGIRQYRPFTGDSLVTSNDRSTARYIRCVRRN
jgi:hypothetical protein